LKGPDEGSWGRNDSGLSGVVGNISKTKEKGRNDRQSRCLCYRCPLVRTGLGWRAKRRQKRGRGVINFTKGGEKLDHRVKCTAKGDWDKKGSSSAGKSGESGVRNVHPHRKRSESPFWTSELGDYVPRADTENSCGGGTERGEQFLEQPEFRRKKRQSG